jgi:plastocyanin
MRPLAVLGVMTLSLLTTSGAQADVAAPASAGVDRCELNGVARVAGKPQPNVVVWLEVPHAVSNAEARPVMHQRNLAFFPRVLAVQVGAVVEFPNEDRVFHNVFSFHDGKRFDLGLYPVGTVRRVTFDRAGLSHLFCNIHPHMAAYVLAVPSAYFAVSDGQGAFTIRGAPCGTHKYQAWRAGSATLGGSVVMNADAQVEVQWP